MIMVIGKQAARAWVAPICVLAMLCGCASTPQRSPEIVREDVRSGQLVRPGDQIVVHTVGRGELEFRVTEVDENAIHGVGVEVSINDIVDVELATERSRDVPEAIRAAHEGVVTIYYVVSLLFLLGVML